MKIFGTRYALTAGITEHDAEINGSMAVWRNGRGGFQCLHVEGRDWHRDWHRTKEEAISRANIMRTKKLAAIAKQVKKLQEMKFE